MSLRPFIHLRAGNLTNEKIDVFDLTTRVTTHS
jgi:hypothetical protein